MLAGMTSVHLKAEHGFSLVEVMVATTILVIGVASLLQLFILAAASTAAAGDMTWATVLATQKLEEIRSEPWGVAASGEDRIGLHVRRWTVAPFARDAGGTVLVHIAVGRPGAEPVVLVMVKTRTSP